MIKNLSEIILPFIPILISLATFCVACVGVIIARQQKKIAREKLRLDLYNRRFEIYSKTIFFFQILIAYDGNKNEEFISGHRNFIEAMKESQFLFYENTHIYKTLRELNNSAFKIIAVKENGKEITSSGDQSMQNTMFSEMQSELEKFPFKLDFLEKSLGKYLNFHDISA